MLLLYKNISFFPLVALALGEKVFLIVLTVVFALLVLVSFLLAFLPDRVSTFSRLGEKVDFNIRYYTYNYATQTVYSFDKKDFSHIKSESRDTFLNQFSGVSHNEVKLWLSRIINGESQEQFLQANVRLSSSKKLMTTMLELTSVNSKKSIIHFSSRMLPFLSPFEEIDLLKAKKIKKVKTSIRIPKRYLLKDEGAAEHFLTDRKYDRIGATFYVLLYSRETLISEEDYQKLAEVNEQIKPALYSFLNRYCKMLVLSETDELIISVSALSKALAINMAMSLGQKIQQQLNLTSNDDRYFIAIGVTDGNLSEKNYKLAKDQSKKMAEAISQGLSRERVLFYDESFFTKYKQTKAEKDEVRMLVRNGTFRLYFTPTIDIHTGDSSLYLLSIEPFGTTVKDFSQVCKIAEDMNLKGRDSQIKQNGLSLLLSSLAEKIQAKAKDKEATIALRVPYSYLKNFATALRSKDTSTHYIFAFQESDILNSDDDPNTVTNIFKDLKSKNIDIGIIIDNASSLLRTRILKMASFFFVPPSFITHKKKNEEIEQNRNNLRNIFATYSKYKTPLVYFGLKNYDDVELGVFYGGSIFECEALAMPSSQLETLDPDNAQDLLDDMRNLLSKSAIELKNSEYLDERNPVDENVGVSM